jgi:DNA-binding transcriptional ArsR family regulator
MSRAAAEQDIFRAVADESRRTILDALAERSHSFQELLALLPITKGAVSQHLAILIACGLVSSSVVNRQRHYILVPEPLQEIDDWLSHFRYSWTRYLEGMSEAMRQQAARRRSRLGLPPT